MNDRYNSLDMNNKLIWNFRDISHTMRRTSEGKGSQKRVLIILLENNGMTQKELTDRLGEQSGSASEILAKLEGNGMILRTANENDRRTTDVVLTEKGRVMAQEAYESRNARHQAMLEVLSDGEKETLIALLERVNSD